jgi:predicted small lipoprotein YifL
MYYLALLLAISACGQKGGLYIPQEQPAAPPEPSQSQPQATPPGAQE